MSKPTTYAQLDWERILLAIERERPECIAIGQNEVMFHCGDYEAIYPRLLSATDEYPLEEQRMRHLRSEVTEAGLYNMNAKLVDKSRQGTIDRKKLVEDLLAVQGETLFSDIVLHLFDCGELISPTAVRQMLTNMVLSGLVVETNNRHQALPYFALVVDAEVVDVEVVDVDLFGSEPVVEPVQAELVPDDEKAEPDGVAFDWTAWMQRTIDLIREGRDADAVMSVVDGYVQATTRS